MISPVFFFVFSLILSSSYASHVQDFCVADYTAPMSPAGYSCKPPVKVTVDDFVFTGLRAPANTSNINKVGVSAAFAFNFPGLNGLDISIARADFAVDGVVSIHSHPRASELVVVVEGTIVAGFIASDNTVYQKTLNKGDTIIIPQGLYHYLFNVGKTPGLAFASFSSQNPGVQVFEDAMFKSDLATDIIAKTTLLDVAQIQKLKKLLGGRN